MRPGEVPERLNGALSKSVVAVRSPWVRIPPSPLLAAPSEGRRIAFKRGGGEILPDGWGGLPNGGWFVFTLAV